MDNVKAAVLIFRLKNLNTIINKTNNAKIYKKFTKIVQIKLPFEEKGNLALIIHMLFKLKRDKL